MCNSNISIKELQKFKTYAPTMRHYFQSSDSETSALMGWPQFARMQLEYCSVPTFKALSIFEYNVHLCALKNFKKYAPTTGHYSKAVGQ